MKQDTNTTQKFETFAPLFPGFYNTVFEYDNEESDIEYYNEENGTDLKWDDFNWNYAEHNLRVSKAFVNKLETEINSFLPITIKFQELRSPKEYNFYTDSINIEVELNLSQLMGMIKDRYELAAKYFKDNYTSYDGFISSHSNNIEYWLDENYISENTGHRIGALLSCLCSIEINADDIIYWCDDESYIDFSPKEEIKA